MSRHQKAKRTGGIYANRSEYFKNDKDPGLYADKGSAHYQGGEELADGYSRVAHQDAPEPVAFTQSRTARKGGGFDLGEKEYIYKKVEQKQAPVTAASTPEPEALAAAEPEKERTPIEYSPEVKQAKERVGAYKTQSIDGSQGSDFKTDESPDAQNFADKYKLNLLNKGETSSDFSGV